MYAIYNKENHLITRVVSTGEENISSLLRENENYKKYPSYAEVQKGVDIRRFEEQGEFRNLEDQINDQLIPLEELYDLEDYYYNSMDVKIINNKPFNHEKTILLSIQKGIKDYNKDPKFDTLPDEKKEESTAEYTQQQTVQQEVFKKDNEIRTLKDQYLNADLDDNEALKMDLKKQIQEAKKELVILQSELTTEPTENNNE